MTKEILPNEEAAERRTNIAGWVCKTCGRFYGDDESAERAARYCCEKDHRCGTDGCPGRAEKGWIYCDSCKKSRDIAAWKALPEEAWDCETPLTFDDGQTYFWGPDDISEYLERHTLKLEDLQLVFAEEDGKPLFDMDEFLDDYLCNDNVDALPDPKGIEDIVNKWIKENCPTTWFPAKKRPTLDSLREQLQVVKG
jgi:hypothetical protein